MARCQPAGKRLLEAARELVDEPSVEVEEDLLEGTAVDAILSVAEPHKADLVVMGARGMGSLNGAVFGSVGTRVPHYAPCTVMVVR